MANLLEYCVTEDNPLFQTKEYQDTIALRQYVQSLRNNLQTENSIYGFTYSMVETMSQIRFHAEDEYKQNSFRIVNKREALPISWGKLLDLFTGNSHDPPQTWITQIAQKHIDIVEHVIQNARKILKRERKSVHISTAQQLDGHCLRWLTRQPGVTAVQKAGSRQKILSVVRQESHNTLENRVLKAFLNECMTGCIFYLQQHGSRQEFSSSERIRAVRRLQNLCQNSMSLPIMDSIADLRGLPLPNYVLLHDPYYSIIWQLYQKLVQHMTLFELAWKHRHILFQDYLRLAVSVILELNYKDTTIYKPEIWINQFIKDGHFLHTRDFSRIIRIKKEIIEFCTNEKPYHEPADSSIDFYLLNRKEKKISFYSAYLPESAGNTELPPNLRNRIVFLHNENRESYPNKSVYRIDRFIEPAAEELITNIMAFLSK